MSKKYIIINGIKFPNNTFFGNLTSNEFDTFQDNIWNFESRVPDWMLKQLKDDFDSSVYNQDFESFYGKWNKFDKNSFRSVINEINIYDGGKIDLTGTLDSAGQLDSTGAAPEDEDPTDIIVNVNQTLDEELTRLEENEEIQNLGDLDSGGLNFQEIKDDLDSLDSSFEVNLIIMAAKGTAAKSKSGASMSKYDVEVEIMTGDKDANYIEHNLANNTPHAMVGVLIARLPDFYRPQGTQN